MAKNQKSYTPEFKQQIVDLHCKAGKGVTELSNEYGIPKGTVSTWIKNLAPVAVSETETISLKEYKALQKKMKELEIENEILKKATAIFAKNQQLNTCPLFKLMLVNILLNNSALHLSSHVALIMQHLIMYHPKELLHSVVGRNMQKMLSRRILANGMRHSTEKQELEIIHYF